MYRIGQATDFHNLVKNGSHVNLGGIKFASDYGIVATSDGDIVLHALSNAVLGAVGLKDIGTYYRDVENNTDSKLDSRDILTFAINKMKARGFKIENLDLMIICEKLIISNWVDLIVSSLKELTNCMNVSVKSTRFETDSNQIQCNAAVLLVANHD